MQYDLAIVKHPETNQKTAELRSINVSCKDKLEKKIAYGMVWCYSRFKVYVGFRVSVMYPDGLHYYC